MSYRIGSFNLRNLGFSALGKNNARDLRKIAQIINNERFDVVALQEVLSEGKAFTSNVESDQIKRSILMELEGNWDFRWAKTGNNPLDTRNEGYAFVWNTEKLRLPVVQTSDGKERTFEPQRCELYKTELIRQPYYARFTPTETGREAPWIELRLLCVHTYFGDDSNSARETRNKEIDVLIKDIYPQIADRRYGLYGNGMPAYTILLGDYNVILARPWKEEHLKEINAQRAAEGKAPLRRPAALNADADDVIETTKWGNRRIKTVQYEYTTLRASEDEATRGYANDYDHFSYEESRFEGAHMSVKRIDAVRKYCGDDFALYSKTVSDHVPIVMDIEFRDEVREVL